MTPQEFQQKQSLPYEAKVFHAEIKAREFYDRLGGNVYCSVGGLGSLTLLMFLREYISKNIQGVSVSSLEDKSIQKIHRTLERFTVLLPLKSKVQIIKEHGFPVISKEYAKAIKMLQNPTERNAKSRHRRMTGICTRANGDTYFSPKTELPKKWKFLFAGKENDKYGTNYLTAPFKVSDECCYYMKERPCALYAKENGVSPYLALMVSEGGPREQALQRNGCNIYGATTRSAPFAPFYRQDLLQLSLDLKVPVPAIYGTIERKQDGTLYTTKAQRTGCPCCGFGIHLEPRPHHFDLKRQENYKEWYFWMYTMGWGEVLDYIGVKWEDEYEEPRPQMELFA